MNPCGSSMSCPRRSGIVQKVNSRSEFSLCGKAGCPICRLHRRLVGQGAEPRPGSILRESGCSLDIRFIRECRCLSRLRLDVPTAKYRRTHDGRMSIMCDFAVSAARGAEVRVFVIELKTGAVSRDAIDQLQAGLMLLNKYLPARPISTCFEAYLVAGKQTAQLKHLLRSRVTHLKVGAASIRLRVHKCGASLSV